MSLFVRPVRLPEERQRLVDLLARNLPHLDHRARFEWLYQRNPAGPGRAWFVCGGGDDAVIGAASIFPKFVWVDRNLEVCAQVGDFAVESSHRSLGPALMLQKATLSPVDQGDFSFCYDCPPHERGMSTFRRLGLASVCRMARVVRPLKAEHAVRGRVPFGAVLEAPLIAAVDVVLRAVLALNRVPRGLEVEAHEGPFGDEFSSLDERLAESYVSVVRSRRHADDLNWKFGAGSFDSYRVVTARRTGILLGFAVYRLRRDRARIVDVSSTSREVAIALLHAAAGSAKTQGASFIDALTVGASSEAAMARRARYFHRSDAEHVVVYGSKPARFQSLSWNLCASDIIA